jgi:hypothetical protein
MTRSDDSAHQSEFIQARVFAPPRFSWNIGNVALHVPDHRNPPSSVGSDRSEAMLHAGLPPWPIQAKLEVGAVDDPLEREADQVAEQVMRMPAAVAVAPPAMRASEIARTQRKCSCGGTCAECRDKQADEELDTVQRKPVGPQHSSPGSSPTRSGMTASPTVHEVLNSPGQSLDPPTRAFFEPRFGHDFSRVRVHADKAAQTSAASIDAQAYTVGHHVAFGSGRFAPQTPAGRMLLAHELAHVIQQGEAVQIQAAPQNEIDQKLTDAISPPRTLSSKLSIGVARKLIQRQVVDPRELRIRSIDTPRHIRVSEWLDEAATPNRGSSRTELYWVDFEVDKKGTMRASVRTVSPDRAYRSGKLRFGEEFKRAVEYFESNGVQVKEFEGDWSYMTRTEISENLKVFKEGMEQGQTREKAAANTPSGKVAAKSEFEVTSVENVPESQEHLAEEGVRRWRVKATFRRRVTEPEAGGGGTTGGKGGGGGGTKAPAGPDVEPGSAETGKSPQVKGQGGAKAPAGTDVEPGGAGKTGGTAPAQKTTGTPSQPGRFTGLGIEVGAGVATIGLDWLAAYLKQKVDQKIASKQVEALMAAAKKKINANPDEAVKKMMTDPGRTVYAWVYLESSVIMSLGVDQSGQPALSDSSPILDRSRIEYQFIPVDPELISSFPTIGAKGTPIIVTRPVVMDLVLTTPPLEDLIIHAKAHSLPLDDLFIYVQGRYQNSLSSLETVLEARQRILGDYQATEDAYQKILAGLQIAKKNKNVALQKSLSEKLTSVDHLRTSIRTGLSSTGESFQKSDREVKYWEHIMALVGHPVTRP